VHKTSISSIARVDSIQQYSVSTIEVVARRFIGRLRDELFQPIIWLVPSTFPRCISRRLWGWRIDLISKWVHSSREHFYFSVCCSVVGVFEYRGCVWISWSIWSLESERLWSSKMFRSLLMCAGTMPHRTGKRSVEVAFMQPVMALTPNGEAVFWNIVA